MRSVLVRIGSVWVRVLGKGMDHGVFGVSFRSILLLPSSEQVHRRGPAECKGMLHVKVQYYAVPDILHADGRNEFLKVKCLRIASNQARVWVGSEGDWRIWFIAAVLVSCHVLLQFASATRI